jgi:hypothetical protein
MTTDELIAEITSGGFAQYEEAGLIDHISLKNWIRQQLKRFGSNIMYLNEAILQVKENRTKLPDRFWNLNLAVKCDAANVVVDDPENVLQNSLFFSERLEGTAEWDNESNSMLTTPQKFVREEFYFRGAKATFNYYQPTFLRLMKGFNKTLCNRDSPNLRQSIVSDNPYQINIVGDYINTNFREGIIYMQYYGLAEDDNGGYLIPETQHEQLKNYLFYFCRTRVLEELIVGDDDPNKINLLNYYNQKTTAYFNLALTETKMEALGKGWASRIRNKQRAQTLKYDVMLPLR